MKTYKDLVTDIQNFLRNFSVEEKKMFLGMLWN